MGLKELVGIETERKVRYLRETIKSSSRTQL